MKVFYDKDCDLSLIKGKTVAIKAFGLDIITDLCDQLHSAGVPGIHFYTMNQAGACSEIIHRLRLA